MFSTLLVRIEEEIRKELARSRITFSIYDRGGGLPPLPPPPPPPPSPPPHLTEDIAQPASQGDNMAAIAKFPYGGGFFFHYPAWGKISKYCMGYTVYSIAYIGLNYSKTI